MLKLQNFLVKPLVRETGILVATLGALAFLSYATGLDAWLARHLYQPGDVWAVALRNYGALAAGFIAWACLFLLFWPGLEKHHSALYRSAATIVIAAVFGAGLINQVIVKDLADRPRPRDIVLADNPPANVTEFKGKSMPSGHAGLGFVLAAPYYVLRRRHPKAANGFLLGGLAYGGAIGVARMVAGAHFLSDVIVAALITLVTAKLAAAVLAKLPAIPRMALTTLVLLVMGAFILGNKFTLDLRYEATDPWRKLQLPCLLGSKMDRSVTNPVISLKVTGYGAPLSQLQLRDDKGTIRLTTERGLFHHVHCQGTLLLPYGTE